MESSFLNPGLALHATGIHEGLRVADFGAGSGFFTRAAARAVGERGVVWAIDAHADLLPRIKNLALAEGSTCVEVIRGNVEKKSGSTLPDSSVDLVIVSNLLFSAERKEALIQEVARVLVRGGKALIIDWSSSHGGLGPHSDHVVTKQEAAKWCSAAGFMHERDVPAGAYHWGFLVRKM